MSCRWIHVHDMLLNETHLGIQRISTSKLLHTPCSAMRLVDDNGETCNQKTTYIMSCVWDHVHDVMRQEPEQCFTVDILLKVSIWLKIIDPNRSASCRMYEIMRINERVVEHKIVQRVHQLFYIIHVVLILFFDIVRCGIVIIRIFVETRDRLIRRVSSCFVYEL